MKLADALIIVGAVAITVGVGLWDIRAGLVVGGVLGVVGGAILSME